MSSRVQKIARNIVKLLPRSDRMYRLAQLYCDEFANHSAENNGDPQTNGEYRLLEEFAPGVNVAFDVGANVGDWTAKLLSLRETANVHAFEPSIGTFAMLQGRRFPPTVLLNNAALSSTVGTATMYVFGEGDGGNALHRREGLEDGRGAVNSATEQIQLDTLDAYCARHGIVSIDFLKIDTEGHEVSVLEGARATLAAGIVKAFQFEYGGTYIDSRRLLKDVFDLLKPSPYTVFSITPDGLVVHPRYDQRLENFRYKNFAVVRNDAICSIASAREAMAATNPA